MEFDLPHGLEILERTPHTLRAMLGGLSTEWIDATEGAETWSPCVVIGHLIHGERTDWLVRAELILAQGARRTFEPYDRFAQFTESAAMSVVPLLEEFTSLRSANLATVRSWQLTGEQLSLTAEHPAFGTVSLRQLLATWAVHDLSHIAQIARVMAKQYREAIGPWRAYLPIVDR